MHASDILPQDELADCERQDKMNLLLKRFGLGPLRFWRTEDRRMRATLPRGALSEDVREAVTAMGAEFEDVDDGDGKRIVIAAHHTRRLVVSLAEILYWPVLLGTVAAAVGAGYLWYVKI